MSQNPKTLILHYKTALEVLILKNGNVNKCLVSHSLVSHTDHPVVRISKNTSATTDYHHRWRQREQNGKSLRLPF